MVVMEKKEKTVFDTMDEPDPANRYRTEIDFAQRLTWGGEYIHAAPWSEGVQGRRNVSHGCVNVSMATGRWLFAKTKVGDPITVKGTERKLEPGNGWTAWSLTLGGVRQGQRAAGSARAARGPLVSTTASGSTQVTDPEPARAGDPPSSHPARRRVSVHPSQPTGVPPRL